MMTETSNGGVGNEMNSEVRSTVPNSRRRISTKTLEGNQSYEKTVAVTTQESLDGIREKAMRIASLDELRASSSAGRWSSSGGAENDRNETVNEIASAHAGSTRKEGDIVVASDNKSKLWKDSLARCYPERQLEARRLAILWSISTQADCHGHTSIS